MALDPGTLTVETDGGITTVTFSHPKANSLPLALLSRIADSIAAAGNDPACRVILLRSSGAGAFSAGASFDEFQAIDSQQAATAFFMGFAQVILAIRSSPRLVVARVHGKAVGGGVGLAAAADYTLALRTAEIRLSEFELGIGPFTVGPAVARKIGDAAFGAITIDTAWRTAEWSRAHGLYAEVHDSIEALDEAVTALLAKLARAGTSATAEIKRMLWAGTEDWTTLLEHRAAISGRLLMESRSTSPAPKK